MKFSGLEQLTAFGHVSLLASDYLSFGYIFPWSVYCLLDYLHMMPKLFDSLSECTYRYFLYPWNSGAVDIVAFEASSIPPMVGHFPHRLPFDG